MSKRSPTEDGRDLDSICEYKRRTPKRPKNFTHESEQFPICSSVVELQMHTLEAQNKKLGDRLAQRMEVEELLRKRIDDLELRQKQDDALLCTVNRYWNQLDRDIQLLLQRVPGDKAASSNNVEEGLFESSEVQESRNWGVKLIERFDCLVRGNERVQELLTKCLEASTPCNGESKDVENSKLCEMLEFKNCYLESQRLQGLLSSLQKENSTNSIQNNELRDQLSLLETEVNELRSRTEEAEFKVEQAVCREKRFITRIWDLTDRVRQHEERIDGQNSSPLPTTSQNGPNSVVDSPLTLDSPLDGQWTNDDHQDDLAQARINELRSLNKQLLASEELVDKLRFEVNHPSADVVKETPVFQSMMWLFHLLYVELNRFAEYHKLAKREITSISKFHVEWHKTISELSVKDDEIFRTAISLANSSWRSLVDKLYDQLIRRDARGKQCTEATAESNPNMLSVCLEEGLKRQLGQLRGEVRRWRMKFDEANAMVQKLQEKLEYEQFRLKDCVLIPFTNGCHEKEEDQLKEDCREPGEIEESDVEEEEEMQNRDPMVRICCLKKRLLHTKRVCRDLEASLEAFKSTSDKMEAAEKFKRLLTENRRLKCCVRAACKQRFSDMLPELQRLNEIQMEDIARLRRSVEESKKEEQSVVTEAESTGQAYEQALEQNTTLLNQIAQKDALITTKIMEVARMTIEVQALQNETADLKAQVEALEQLLKTKDEQDILHQREVEMLHQNCKLLVNENRIREENLVISQWTMYDVARRSFSMKSKLRDLELQLEKAQLSLESKMAMIEKEQQARRTLQDEVFKLKRKLEKVKKMGRLGPRDEVLNEENRHLKELLTCPSCKVNRKDATLLKCFHVFCSSCLKKRYDTRQRKCPKCTQAFGINDIKRIFI
uniref:E3 ubiquitin protein ligase n=1 Tax=Trichuris muris TaxID=70415 RepID=A0A5S6PZU2_TRIMR